MCLFEEHAGVVSGSAGEGEGGCDASDFGEGVDLVAVFFGGDDGAVVLAAEAGELAAFGAGGAAFDEADLG